MTQQPSNPWPYIALLMLVALLVWPSVKGCTPGLEIGLPWPIGKITLKPVTPPKPVEPPKTRCLVFGSDSCKYCRQLARTIHWSVAPQGWKVGANNTDDIEEINANSSDRRVKKFKPTSLPTLVIVDQSENEVARWTRGGIPTAQELITWIQSTR
jgi:glutaredoxin